jgi:UDP-N-acetylglucosamine 2-epimerase (non-hydrolysing)
MKLTLVAGARPNFIKIAPLIRALETSRRTNPDISWRLVHTGQHYDDALSRSFFRDLNIPTPHKNLGAGSGTQAEQTAAIMIGFEKELLEHTPRTIVVVGDVNSTLACSIVAKKLCIDVVHVEAGIRSGDMSMPEEINRIVTDSISDHFFTTTIDAGNNLRRGGIPDDRIHFVGNTMIDTLIYHRNDLVQPAITRDLAQPDYLVLTLHRPSNVDRADKLSSMLTAISAASREMPIIFPVHPRTSKNLNKINLDANVLLCEPMRYLEFMHLVKYSKGVITDSGGIQEETTYLKVPCITLRNTTERPETVTIGSNELVGDKLENISRWVSKLAEGKWKLGETPEFWDGETSNRIVTKLIQIYK